MSEATTLPDPETLESILLRLQIDEWDLLLVGDGSGSKWGYATGWACVAIYPNEVTRRVYFGATNNGTVNMAESLAYLAPLSEFMAGQDKLARMRHVHIITDSEYVRTQGGKPYSVKAANSVVWASYAMLNRMGIQLHWHWMRRNCTRMNWFADAVSRAARLHMEKLKHLDTDQTVDGVVLSELNP